MNLIILDENPQEISYLSYGLTGMISSYISLRLVASQVICRESRDKSSLFNSMFSTASLVPIYPPWVNMLTAVDLLLYC